MEKTIKSSLEAQGDIKARLASTSLPSMISGQIRQNMRVLGSTKEDIVINTLIWDADQFQGGIFNVNIHVPNLKNQTAENPTAKDNTQPDIARFEQLGKVASGVLDYYEGEDFSLRLRSPGKLENYGTEWIYNIQVEYLFLREDI